jgi:UDPglucose 6-dehydrogenase
VVGAGHVGLVSAICLAALGHEVRVLDVDRSKIERLSGSELPFYEPGLAEVLARIGHTRITFHHRPERAIPGARVVFLCVNTPNDPEGRVDISALVAATCSVAPRLDEGAVLVNRSTAPVGTAEYIRSLVREERRGEPVKVAVNPEFLSEGNAVRDFLSPDRIVVGAWEEADVRSLLLAYEPIVQRRLPAWLGAFLRPPRPSGEGPVPVVLAEPPTAELTKYAANAFLAVRISFINEMGQIAEEVGADVVRVAEGIGLDRRIGPHFLRAGIGWGGSCFPKDIEALQGIAETRGLSAKILRAANEVNAEQRAWITRKLQHHLKTLVGRRVALLGLAFKPDTDDLRSSPAVEVAVQLSRLSMRVTAFDPMVKELPPQLDGIVRLAPDAVSAARDAEALVVLTEWSQFGQLDLDALRSVMRVPLLLDGRNLFDPGAARAAGFTYAAVGR